MEEYNDFKELATYEREGCDFLVNYRFTNSRVAVIAPHGGAIEPGTLQIADAVAGTRHNFYGFQGTKAQGNSRLHLTSTRFDEPRALMIAGRSHLVITIHGLRGDAPQVVIGGRHCSLKMGFVHGLQAAGFPTRQAVTDGLRGCHPANLCNRGKGGMGVQLEFSLALRKTLFDQQLTYTSPQPTQRFHLLTQTISAIIDNHLSLSGPVAFEP